VQTETKAVVWEWLPGIVAGLMPLVVYGIVVTVIPEEMPPHHPVVHVVRNGWIAHLLVWSIVTSTVSTLMAYPRLFSFRQQGAAAGGASLGLVMLNTLMLVFSVALYTLHETRLVKVDLTITAIIFTSAIGFTSLIIEFVIANLRIRLRNPDGVSDHAL